METIKLNSHVGADGVLQVQMPTNFKERDVEVVVVIQPLEIEKNLADKLENTAKKPKISKIIAGFRQLRQEIPSDNFSVREMIEEGRRF